MNSLLYYRANNTAGLICSLSGAKDTEAIKKLFADPKEGNRYNSLFADSKEDVIYLLTSEHVTEQREELVGKYFIICFSINNGVQTISGKNIAFHFSRSTAPYPETLLIRQFECRDLLSLCPEEGAEIISALTSEQLLKAFPYSSNASVCSEADYLFALQQAGKKNHSELLKNSEHFVFHYNPYIFRSEDGLKYNALSLHMDLEAESRSYRPTVYFDSYLLTNNDMQIKSSSKFALLSPLKENPMTPPQAKEMIQRKLSIPLADGSDLLCSEDYQMIRKQTNLWTDSIRLCDPSRFIQEAFDAESPDLLCDVIMPVQGYQGFQEQFEMMERMRALQPKKQGVHTLSTPYISLLSEDTAVAYYLDFGWTMMGEAFGNSGPRCPALPDVGRYIFKLKKKDDTWKVFELNWGPIIQYGMWFFDEDLSAQE